MARNDKNAYDLQEMWAVNLAPYVTAARQGAGHAMRTANRERMRARMRSQMGRQRRRWMLMAVGASVALVGIAGAISAARARRETADQYPRQGDFGPGGAVREATGRRPQPSAPASPTSAGQRGSPQ